MKECKHEYEWINFSCSAKCSKCGKIAPCEVSGLYGSDGQTGYSIKVIEE